MGKIRVKNRLVRSATFDYGGDDSGRCRQNMYDVYEGLAKGGVGLIIIRMVGIDENSRASPYMVKTYDDTFAVGLTICCFILHLSFIICNSIKIYWRFGNERDHVYVTTPQERAKVQAG
ncbi:hypothetical protein [Lacrimispora sp. 38-1]|uniref:hypothetical protein n=1 Tax=Lacrimispora sp. 38-1 TaxID=3125778 RepID=UPI003CE79296